jgi:hypothetical protein
MEAFCNFILEHWKLWLLISVLAGSVVGVVSYLIDLWEIKFGLLFRIESWWVGIHYSPYNKRFCINPLPMFTLWIAACDGKVPEQGFDIFRNDKGVAQND